MFSRFKKTDQPAVKSGTVTTIGAGAASQAPASAASKPAVGGRTNGGPVAMPKASAEVVAAEKEKKRKDKTWYTAIRDPDCLVHLLLLPSTHVDDANALLEKTNERRYLTIIYLSHFSIVLRFSPSWSSRRREDPSSP